MTPKTAQFLMLLFLLTFCWSCAATKEPHTHFICVKQDGVPSQILRNEQVGIADTSVAFISGNVSDLVTSENISYAVVTFKDESTEKVYGQSTDTLGKFSIIIPAGSYTFKVFFVGYAEINLDLTIRTGEMREINTGLGQDEAFVTYEINSPKKLNRRQLREEANKLNIKE